MHPHHEESVRNIVRLFEDDAEVKALLLGGSVAHGFARPTSDIDLVIVVSDEDHARRAEQGRLHFFDHEVCPYLHGYAEGKYVGESFLEAVADHGSEPARYALHDARALIERADYSDCLRRIARYPVEGKQERIRSYHAQLETWCWYAGEARKLDDPYLLGTSVSKLVLFAGRMILTHNELLYPYHKWFLRVLEAAEDKPPDLMENIAGVYREASEESVARLRECILGHREWETHEAGWPHRFLIDSELNWLDGAPPVDDW